MSKIIEALTQWEFWTDWEFWTAAVTTAATIAIATFTYTLKKSTDRLWDAGEKQAQLTRDSIELARREFEYTHRARVSIFDVVVEDDVADRANVNVKFRLENTGGLPATGLMVSYSTTAGPEWHPPTARDFHVAPQVEEMSIVLAAKESKLQQGATRNFSVDDYRKAKQHGIPHYLRFGIIVAYRDGFDRDRTTWKWFEWNPESGTFRECAARQD